MSSQNPNGYISFGRTGTVLFNDTLGTFGSTQPGNGETVTLFSTLEVGITGLRTVIAGKGFRFKMLVFDIFSSAASAANGYQVDESNDGGVTWDNLQSTTIPATTYTKVYTKVSGAELRCRYVNSANVLTTFRWSLMGDTSERGNG
jgi:hypothetical protein